MGRKRQIYEHALKLWEGLEDDLGYPILFSQRGVLNLAHNLQDVRDSVRRVEANKLNGIDAQWVEPDDVKKLCPIVNTSSDIRYPVLGATYQPRGASPNTTTSHGASPAAPIRPASTSSRTVKSPGSSPTGDKVTGVRHPRRHRGRAVLCAAGHTSVLTDMLGIRTPVQSHPLQALVSELLEPVHPTVVMSNAVHVYVSQAHKGELVMGAGIDAYNGYGQRGAFHIIERQMAAAVELFPVFARAHLLRTWAGIVDVCPDASPIVGRTPYDNVYLNCGWGTGVQGHRAGVVPRGHHRQRRAARVHRAVQPGPVRYRRPRRRARRLRRRALTIGVTATHRMPVVRAPRRRSSITAARRTSPTADPQSLTDEEWAQYVFFRSNPKGSSPNGGATAPAAGAGSTPFGTPPPTDSTACTAWTSRNRQSVNAPFRTPAAVASTATPRFTFAGGTDRPRRRHPGLGTARQRHAPDQHQHQARPAPRHHRGLGRGHRQPGPDRGAIPEPMLLATTIELFDGLVAAASPGRAGSPRSRTPPATTPSMRTPICWWSVRPGGPGRGADRGAHRRPGGAGRRAE